MCAEPGLHVRPEGLCLLRGEEDSLSQGRQPRRHGPDRAGITEAGEESCREFWEPDRLRACDHPGRVLFLGEGSLDQSLGHSVGGHGLDEPVLDQDLVVLRGDGCGVGRELVPLRSFTMIDGTGPAETMDSCALLAT